MSTSTIDLMSSITSNVQLNKGNIEIEKEKSAEKYVILQFKNHDFNYWVNSFSLFRRVAENSRLAFSLCWKISDPIRS